MRDEPVARDQIEASPYEEMWRGLLTGENSPVKHDRARFLRLPGSPRCKTCLYPLGGPVARIARLKSGRGPSRKNPNYCNLCEEFVRTHPGGAEIEISLLFADVRGSTTLAEQISPAEFTRLMNRFFGTGNKILIDSDAMVDKMVGDEIMGFYIPTMAPDNPRRAVEAARSLLLATGHADTPGPWLPVGAGVHTGMAYVGAVGADSGVADFTAMGDAVNVAARLASLAGAGEVLITEDTCAKAEGACDGLESRTVNVKGRTAPVELRVLKVAPTEGTQK